MKLRRREIPVFIFNCIYLVIFGGISLVPPINYEFVLYAGVIVVFFLLILFSQRKVEFPLFILWGLTSWGFLHMGGGHISVGEGRLYDLVLIPIVTRGEDAILRYDHVVHTIGFGMATIVCFHLIKGRLRSDKRGLVLASLVALMGMGLGALNEVIELIVVLVVPESGVGGYYNTTFDLLFNMIGAILAVLLLRVTGYLGSMTDEAAGDESALGS
ncbi:MAG: DUF2238 domain-containing protein [Candidatus Brocadiia bacterium]